MERLTRFRGLSARLGCQRIERLCLSTPAHTFKRRAQGIRSYTVPTTQIYWLVEPKGRFGYSIDFMAGEMEGLSLNQQFALRCFCNKLCCCKCISVYFHSPLPPVKYLAIYHTLDIIFLTIRNDCQPFNTVAVVVRSAIHFMTSSSVLVSVFLSSPRACECDLFTAWNRS